MAALPVTFGAVSASYTHEDGTTEEIAPKELEGNKGELEQGSYTGGTLVLNVDDSTNGENAITELDSYVTTQNATTSITISGNSSVSVDGKTIGLVASSSQGFGESFSNINVTGGGSFHMSGTASTIGEVGSKHGISHTTIEISGQDSTVDFNQSTIGYIRAYNGESHTEITITDHGKFEVKYDSQQPFSIGTIDTYDSSSFTTITVSGEGEFLLAGERDTVDIGRLRFDQADMRNEGEEAKERTGYTETIINVNEGGKFTHQGGSIATCGGVYGSVIANGADIPKTDLKINVNGGVYAIEQKKEYGERWIGCASATYGLYAASASTVINVTNGGQFNIDGSGVRMAYADAQGSNYGAETSLEINVSGKDSVFFIEPEEEGTNPEIYIGDTADGTTSVIVDVSQGGSFSMLSKAVGSASSAEVLGGAYAATAERENPASSTVNIKLHDQGAMTLQTADHSTMSNKNKLYSLPNGIGICRAISGGNASVETTISVGDQSTFEFKSGEIGMAYISGASTATSTTSIIVEEGGTFTMDGGYLSHSYVASAATGSVNQTLSIDLKGANMTITGGSILASEGGRTAGERSGSIDISGDSLLTIGEGVEIGDDVAFAITMHGGTLAGDGISKLSENENVTVSVDVEKDFSGKISLGGVSTDRIEEFKVNGANTLFEGIGDGTITLQGGDSITLGAASVWVDGSEEGKDQRHAAFQFATSVNGTVNVQEENGEGDKFILHLDPRGLDFTGAEKGITLKVWITDGTLDESSADRFAVGTGWGLTVSEYDAQDGTLTLTGELNVWDAEQNGDSGHTGHASANAGDLTHFDKVIIDEETTLTADQDATLKQLDGVGKDSNLTITNKTPENPKDITLHNEDTASVENSGRTSFAGDITINEGVNLKKTGNAELAIEGNLNAKGDVSVEEGTLAFGKDSESSIGGKLTLGEEGTLDVDGKLTLNGQGNDLSGVTSGQLTGEGSIFVGDGGSLKVDSEMLGAEDVPGFGATGSGRLELTGNAPVDLEKLAEGTTGTVTGNYFTSSAEDASFAGSIEGTLTVEGGSLNMSNAANSSCDLVVQGEDTQVTIAAGSTYKSIDNQGRLSTSTSEETGDVCITAEGNIIFRNGAHSPVRIDLSDPELSQSGEEINYKSTAGKIIIEHETELDVTLTGNILDAKGDLNVVIMEATGGIENHEEYNEQTANYKMKTVRFMAEPQVEEGWTKVEAAAVVKPGEGVNEAVMNQLYDVGKTTFWTKDGQLLTYIPQRTESPWEQYATTSNSRSGLGLLYRNLHQSGVMEADRDVVALVDGIDRLVQSNPAEARRALAAVAGSTLTSLSAAQSAALRNQMGRVRDHALQAGRLRCAGNDDEATAQQRPCRNSHVWVEGTSFFSEQHSVGDESGYRLNSWGGAVGIDAQVDAHWSVGVSLSASYGDLEARAADYAKGDLDTYTVSFWSQAKNGRWGNTLLFTLGTNEADLKRTVNYGAGSYTATSNTSGSSLGAMWEVTYDLHPVKDNKSNILQPLFNVAVMHTSMDGFSEGNAGGVGLTTEKQTRDTVTLGLGLRWLAAINSAKAINRTVTTELHANVAQDLGDRRSVANVALLADPSYTQNVYGSKAGSTAFQFGAGVNVPMTPNSQIYVNAGGELREHANAWNAALGVRMGF